MLILVEKDTEPLVLAYTVDGMPVSGGIAGYAFTMNIGYETVLSKAAVIHNTTACLVRFDWETDDLKAGDWDAEVIITNPAGKERTLKTQKLRILKRIS